MSERVEAACPSFTRGAFAYDYCDLMGLIPLAKMYTLGHTFVPPGIHAGGLRYHGDSPLLSHLRSEGHIDAEAYGQLSVFEAGDLFVKTEGFLPAPESCHAIRAAIDEALKAKDEGKERVILFGLSGHGFIDLASYEAHVDGALADSIARDEDIRKSLADVPAVDEVPQAA
jgi:tryptophan synthase beta chain